MIRKLCLVCLCVFISCIGMMSSCKDKDDGGKTSGDLVQVRAGITANTVMDYTDMQFFKDLEKEVGVRFNMEVMSSEQVTLMYSSGDFVDVMFSGGTDRQILIAANSGDVVKLDDLIKTEAPTWAKLFEENEDIRRSTVFPDGGIWSLPYIRTLEADRGIRDVWWINKTWMNQLNLKMPQTLDDFIGILTAFKNNAGQGAIPADVEPWYFLSNSMIGGPYDFFNTFGMTVYDSTMLTVRDGKVVSQAAVPELKEAVKVMRQMYINGLISPNCYTGGGNLYMQRTNQVMETPNVGVFTSYWTPNEDYVAMPVFKSSAANKAYIRQQPLGVIRNRTVIFKKCKDPAAVMRAMEWIVQPDNAIYLDFGLKDKAWTKDGDVYTIKGPDDSDNNSNTLNNITPGNAIAGILDSKFEGKIVFETTHAWAKRDTAAKELYNNSRIPIEWLLPPLSYTESETLKIDEYKSKICNEHISASITKWVKGEEDIEAGWDAYTAKLKTLGNDDFIAITQKALDRFNAN